MSARDVRNKHVGILGGTFDPPHLGHLHIAHTALAHGAVDELWWMPTASAPHKESAACATMAQRLQMVQRTIAGEQAMSVCDMEVMKGGVSYTVETAELLCNSHPQTRFSWIIGADMICDLPRWREIEQLAQMITFIGLSRPGYKVELHTLPVFLQAKVELVPMTEKDISSTEVRKRLAARQTVAQWVAPDVIRYIEENGLYED